MASYSTFPVETPAEIVVDLREAILNIFTNAVRGTTDSPTELPQLRAAVLLELLSTTLANMSTSDLQALARIQTLDSAENADADVFG